MKKFFAAVLTVFLSLGLLTACGGRQQHGASSAPAVQSAERTDTGSPFPKTVNNPTQKVRAARKSV